MKKVLVNSVEYRFMGEGAAEAGWKAVENEPNNSGESG